MPAPTVLRPRRLVRAAGIGALALATALPMALPAAAGTLSVADRVGDAVPVVDATRLTVTNGTSQVRVAVTVPRLRPGRVELATLALEVGSARTPFVVISSRRADGAVRARLWQAPFASDLPERPRRCAGLQVRWRAGSGVRFVVPQSCLRSTGPVRAGVYLARERATKIRHQDWATGRYGRLGAPVPRG
jgi:hypothetical protein